MMEILEAREQRVQRQRELLSRFPAALICFTLNMPGPEKNSPLTEKGFQLGCRLLKRRLKAYSILHFAQHCSAAGWEGYFCVDAPADALKRITVALEDKTPGGRIFDMDVLTPEGSKLDRESLGYPRRKCLLCDMAAVICGRSRVHSLEALQQKLALDVTETLGQKAHIGLINVHARLRLRWGALGGIQIENGEQEGVRVTLSIGKEQAL